MYFGAGKTTTMSLITGALFPDEGWAMVAGFDVVSLVRGHFDRMYF